MYNQSGPADSRKVLSGKDAVLFNGEGVMLATIENFQVQVNVSNSDYQPLGDAQAHATMTGYHEHWYMFPKAGNAKYICHTLSMAYL